MTAVHQAGAGHHRFETALGQCAIAWSRRGICRLLLPGASAQELRALKQVGPAAAPSPVADRAIRLVQRHLSGTPQRLERVPVDLDGASDLHRQIYHHLRAVPPGTTVTYAQLAARAGTPGAARAVGQAMGRNPVFLLVPCHRVTAANGRAGGFSAAGGLATKERLLLLEGLGRASEGARRLGLEFDPARALRHLRAADPALARHVRRLGPYAPRTAPRQSPFASLLSAIVYQQLSGKAAATILGRVRALFAPGRFPRPEEILAAPEADLRTAGLSRNKLAALRDLAARTLDGTVPTLSQLRRLPDEEIVARLTAVRGVGRWTAEMLLLKLGRPDVLAVHDLGLQKGFARTVGNGRLPSPERLARYGERWRPYRSVASWYLWRAVDQGAS